MKILLINLKQATQRLAFQKQQFSCLGLPFERINACSIEDIEESTYQQAAFDWERPLSRAEFACYQSHRKAWLDVINTNQPALILEDDAYISNALPELLNQLHTKTEVDLITLEARARKKLLAKHSVEVIKGYSLLRLYQDRSGAAGYILWPAGARELLKQEKKRGVALTDAQISRTYNLKAFQLEPAPIIQLDCCDYYQIEAPINTQSATAATRERVIAPDGKTPAKCKRQRILGQSRMGIRQLSVLHKAQRREVEIDKSHFAQNEQPEKRERT